MKAKLADLMSLIFRAETSSIPTVAGNAIKNISNFHLVCPHWSDIVGRFWLREIEHVGVWQCQLSMLSKCLSVCAISSLQRTFSLWRLPWSLLDSFQRECKLWGFPHIQMCGPAFTISTAATLFPHLMLSLGYKKGNILLALFLGINHAIFWWWDGKKL